MNGFNGQVSFIATGINSPLTWSFNPPFPTVPAGGTATSTLTISDGASKASAGNAHMTAVGVTLAGIGCAFPIGLFLLAKGSRHRRAGRLLLVLLLFGIPSCGGGGGGGGGDGGGGGGGGGAAVVNAVFDRRPGCFGQRD